MKCPTYRNAVVVVEICCSKTCVQFIAELFQCPDAWKHFIFMLHRNNNI